ncbi:MAG: IS4 family transposase, partial [bacterium]
TEKNASMMDNLEFTTTQKNPGDVRMVFYNIIRQICKIKETMISSVVKLLREEDVDEVFGIMSKRKRIYHAVPLIQLYLIQVASCITDRATVSRGINQGWLPITTSVKSSSYCETKSRLPEGSLKELAMRTGRSLEQCAQERWTFVNRPVKVVDGTSVQLPDTPANQREYPQPKPQKEGCGFPVMNLSVLMGLESGGIIDMETIAGTGYEHPLFRKLWRSLDPGDIVMGDKLYGSFAEVALLRKMGVDCVFRAGTKKFKPEDAVELANGDWLYLWKRPKSPGEWIDADKLPESILVRVIHAVIRRKGFRSKRITIYTTLLDPDEYPRSELLELYRRRWEMELRLRDIKTTMGLEMLKSKTPSGCRKELWVGILLYNLIRTIMLDAALRYKICMSRLSHKGTLDRFSEMMNSWFIHVDPGIAYEILIRAIAQDNNPYRPFRFEPRRIKRRPKNYRLLNIPREIEHKLIEIGYIT